MKFGVLHLDGGDARRRASNDDARDGNELKAVAAGSRSITVAFIGDGVLVRLAPASDAVWDEATALRQAAGARIPQVGLAKLRDWVGPIVFPMFAHHDDGPSTVRIPRMDEMVIEVGGIAPSSEIDAVPELSDLGIVFLSAWAKEHLH